MYELSLGTGDIVFDMENQVKANTIRIQVLEEQNETLRNSVSKVLNLQQDRAPPKVAWENVRVTYSQTSVSRTLIFKIPWICQMELEITAHCSSYVF